MKKMILASIAALALSGCASSVAPPMPVDSNPSEALKFARAMDLRVISDEGENYFVYNHIDTGNYIYPLQNPVRAGQAGKVQSAGNGMADVAAGMITNTSLIPVLGVLTARGPAAVMDGVPRIGSWTDDNQYKDGKEVVAIVKANLPLMDGYSESKACAENGTGVSFMNKRRGANGKPIDLNPESLPRPPVPAKGMLKPFGFSPCFFYVASKPSNQARFQKMSAQLGEKRALFIPGYQEHQPYVYYNGKAFTFSK